MLSKSFFFRNGVAGRRWPLVVNYAGNAALPTREHKARRRRIPWSVHISSGAKHRSCATAKLKCGSNALATPTEPSARTPDANLLAGWSAASFTQLLAPLRRHNMEATCSTCDACRMFSGRRPFAKTTIERLAHNIACACVNESGVPIDLLSGGFIQRNSSTDMGALVDLKWCHCFSL